MRKFLNTYSKLVSFFALAILVSVVSLPAIASLCSQHHVAKVETESQASCHDSKTTASTENRNHDTVKHSDDCPICLFKVCHLESNLEFTFQEAKIVHPEQKDNLQIEASAVNTVKPKKKRLEKRTA